MCVMVVLNAKSLVRQRGRHTISGRSRRTTGACFISYLFLFHVDAIESLLLCIAIEGEMTLKHNSTET